MSLSRTSDRMLSSRKYPGTNLSPALVFIKSSAEHDIHSAPSTAAHSWGRPGEFIYRGLARLCKWRVRIWSHTERLAVSFLSGINSPAHFSLLPQQCGMSRKSILFVFTSVQATDTGRETGSFVPGLDPLYFDLAPHFDITFASPSGKNPPIETVRPFLSLCPRSSHSSETLDEHFAALQMKSDTSPFISDPTVQEKLSNAIKLSDVKVADYDAVYYVPSLGLVLDLASSELNGKVASDVLSLLSLFTDNDSRSVLPGNILSGLCHAPA